MGLKTIMRKITKYYKTSLTESNDNLFINICNNAAKDNIVFDNFRTNNIYTKVLEHVDNKTGQKYLNMILQSNQFALEDFKDFERNDWYGGATIRYWKEVGYFSPSTLRYIKVLSDIKARFDDLNGKEICEIGVGYGGQARILMSFFKNIKSYTFVDLESVLLLAEKYLSHFKDIQTDMYFATMEDLQPRNYDLIISNYAFSELRKHIQDIYIDKIIKNSKHGYITYNNIAPNGFNYTLQDYTNVLGKSINIEEETPQTHPLNKIITW